MTETGYTDTHTTTTPTTSVVYFDTGYFRTIPGYLKIAEMALDLLGFICVLSSYLTYDSRATWFNTVAMGGFWYSAIVMFCYAFHVPEKLTIIPWKKIELVFCALWTFFYLIAASLVADRGFIEAFAAAAFFGFCAMVAYGIDAWLSFQKAGVVIVRTPSQPTSPTQY